MKIQTMALSLLLVLTACGGDSGNSANSLAPEGMENLTEQQVQKAGDIVDVASSAQNFNTLLAAAGAADLVETLKSEGPFTVFAPTDAAFAALPEGTVENLLKPENKEALKNILLYHVLAGKVVAEQAVQAAQNGATPEAANGLNLKLSLNGGGLFVNTSKVIATDITASNGVIHVIDQVLLPEAVKEESEAGGLKDIVDTAVEAGSFTTLVAAVKAADLVETLKSEGPFTVFAPTDAAFAALPEGTVETLLKPENRQTLTDILTYHVVAGAVPAEVAVTLSEAQTVLGQKLKLEVREEGALFINESKVVVTDIMTSNGVIHIIDAVLLP